MFASAKLAVYGGEGEARAGAGSEKPMRADRAQAASGGASGFTQRASTSTIPTARCGPACRVVWEGLGQRSDRPYPDVRPAWARLLGVQVPP